MLSGRFSRLKMLTLAFVVALGASVAMLGISGAWAVVDVPETGEEHSHDVFDIRDEDDPLELLETQKDAMNEIEGATRVEVDPTFGTPRKIIANDGYLTGTASGDAEDVARDWISENLDLLGVSSADAFIVTRNHELPESGTRVITFQQTLDGLQTVYGGRINLAVTDDGRVLSYTGNPTRSDSLTGEFALSEVDALSAVAGEVGGVSGFSPQRITADATDATANLLGPTTEAAGIEYTNFERGTFAAPSSVARVIFPTGDGAIPAFRVLFVEELDEAYDVIVNAGSGEILFQRSLVAHQATPEATGSVYRNYPGANRGGALTEVSFDGNQNASPCGWLDVNPLCQTVGQVDGITTFGNNADTHANWDSFLVPNPTGDRPEDSEPATPGTQFNFPYDNNWADQNGQGVSYQADLNPAATSLFWHHNRIHDEYYALGFTESAGNFQVNNFDEGGAGADPIQGLVQAGAASGGAPTFMGRNNAYMLTMPDGMPSWSGMFLWEPIPAVFESPFVDGDFDASVIQHEYTHGLTTRYVAGGEALGAHQSGAMGEGWSDWYALDYLYRNALESEAVVGKYVTGNDGRGIRNWDYDENPLTYGDIGYDITGPAVHADGELWAATLWDLRKALVAKYGEQNGAARARALITDAQPLTAPDPSYLDARDGILLADFNRGGQQRDIIWSVFAKRGMGNSASTDGGDDTDPTAGFDHPSNARNGNIIGKATNDSTGKPVAGARVFLGDFEARSTPAARTGAKGGFGEKVVAGTYSVTIQAPGFGSRTFKGVKVVAGKSRTLEFSLTPNLVSERNGAKIVSVSSEDPDNPIENLLDDSEASVWSTEKPPASTDPTAETEPFDQAQVTVRLREVTNVRAVRLSAFKNINDARFAAMKNWKVETSMDGKTWKLRKRGAFLTDDPRPVTPELQLRRVVFDNPLQARFVRFTIDSIQDDSVGYAEAAELQVYSQTNEGFTPMKIDSDKPFSDSGTIVAGNSATGDPGGTGVTVLGATGTAYQQNCGSDPDSPQNQQGADGWVSVLPSGFGDGNHVVTVKGAEPQDQDLDLYFLNSKCEVVGSQATPSANESGVLPGGAKYVLTVLYSGANEKFNLRATSAP